MSRAEKFLEKQDTKSSIISAAARLFAEKGYKETTISDIAKLIGLSEASLYQYFPSKEALLLTIPDVWVRNAIQDINEHLFGIKGAFNKLRKFLWWYIRYIEREPDIAKVVFLFLKTNRNFMNTDVYENVREFYSILLQIFEEGISSGEMRQELNPYLARSVFLGTIEHIVIRWLLKDMSYSLLDNLEAFFEIFLKAFEAKDEKGS